MCCNRVEKNRKEDDTGEYWCLARNDQGTAVSNRAKLEIACKCIMYTAKQGTTVSNKAKLEIAGKYILHIRKQQYQIGLNWRLHVSILCILGINSVK
jgi:hypothetical protein